MPRLQYTVSRLQYKKHRSAARIGTLLVGMALPATAQDALIQAPPAVPTPAPSETFGNQRAPASFYASSKASVSSALVHEQEADFWGAAPFEEFLNNPLQWGPFQLRPFGAYRYTYGNGLNATPGRQEKTSIHQISPGVAIQSPHLTFRYSPSLSYYSNDAFENHVDHAASAAGHFGVGDWRFSLSHSFSKSSSPLIETGAQTEQQTHSTVLSALYQYSQKTSFNFNLSQNIQEADALNSSTGWSSMNWLNYHWSEETVFGIGLGGGYTTQDFGFDMTHEQIQGRVGWRPGAKLSFDLNGGIELRQFVDSPFDDQVNPIFGASVSYQPWEPTTFFLSANQSVGSSLLQTQTTENRGVTAGLRQRLLGTLNLDLFGGYSTVEYKGFGQVPTGNDLETNRTDDVLSFSATLGVTIFTKGNISIFYQRSENDSSTEDFGFTSNQYGFQIGYHF
jgi:hypothetical protein